MKILVDIIYVLISILLAPLVIYRMLRYNRYLKGWSNRIGNISRNYPEKRCIWIHAVSVGEVNATRTIVKELEKQFPDFEVVISTTTDTGFERASRIYSPGHCIFYFPFDFSLVTKRSFGNIRPAVCLLMELEVWPNFTLTANELKIPVVVVNGRITETSCSRYKIIKPVAKKIFGKLTAVLAQTPAYARRFIEIGTPPDKVILVPSLKYDTAEVIDKVDGADELAKQLNIGEEKLWVAGGTGNNEEKILLDVYQDLTKQERFRNLRFVIVPRKPERFNEAAQLLKERKLDFVRYSTLKNTDKSLKVKTPVVLGDTMGDLRKFYSIADIVFVGRSLVPMGGSDMIEAAALGKCAVFGPHTFNFTHTVRELLSGEGAIQVKDKKELSEIMQKCLSDKEFTAGIAQRGQKIIQKNQGGTRITIEHIKKLL